MPSRVTAETGGSTSTLIVDQQLLFPEAIAERARWIAEVQTTLAINNDRSPEQLQLALKRYLDEPVDNTQDRTLTTLPLDPVIESLLELKAMGLKLKEDWRLYWYTSLQTTSSIIS